MKGWADWWKRAETEAIHRRIDNSLTEVSRKQGKFKTRLEPNLMQKGWKTVWSKMEAEGRRNAKRVAI